ncbi:hypothetical protein MMC30_006450 [Trapelia coarctata]|nr:hypothetical protein [Trapelia coarctata]
MTTAETDAQPELNSETTTGQADDKQTLRLRDLTAQATAKYAVKDYNAAAELYSMATELQAEINGEMSTQNADLLYAYGRCLYHVAVSNSDVLGSKVAGEKREESKKAPKTKRSNGDGPPNGASFFPEERVAEEGVAIIANGNDSVLADKESVESKPFFQFTGDDNYDDSDDDAEGAEGDDGDGEGDAEDDDFSNAFEVLDLARLLLQRRLEELQGNEGEGKATGDSEMVRQLKERLADTYDLQAEISLEGERFPNAVVDLKAALRLKEELFPQDSSLIAEGHYKLSLALEFSSVTQQKDQNGDLGPDQSGQVDEEMREEAAKEMEAAITSCKVRIEKEEAALVSGVSANGKSRKPKITKESIEDVKDMVKEMEQRLVELRQPPGSLNDPTGTGAIDGANPLSGILGSILGESPEAQKTTLEEAAKGATDLTNLVRRKKPAHGDTGSGVPVASSGKRKLEAIDESEDASRGKKTKSEDV